jgi:hypothetical protein
LIQKIQQSFDGLVKLAILVPVPKHEIYIACDKTPLRFCKPALSDFPSLIRVTTVFFMISLHFENNYILWLHAAKSGTLDAPSHCAIEVSMLLVLLFPSPKKVGNADFAQATIGLFS